MKKFFVVITLLIAVVLCSCTTQKSAQIRDDTYNIETDMQYYYRYQCYVNPITASKDGYYYVGNHGIVLYIDKKTMKSTPLCNKANCKHDNPETCNAYIIDTDSFDYSEEDGCLQTLIQYYEGYIYYLGFEYDSANDKFDKFLYRRNLDGTNSTRITNSLRFGNEAFEDWFIHRGYFYYVTDRAIYRFSMDSPKSEAQTVFELKEYFKQENNIKELKAYGDYIYFNATEANKKNKTSESKLYCQNIKNLKYKEISYKGNNINNLVFINGKLVFRVSKKVPGDRDYYIADLDLQNPEKLTTQKWGYTLSADGQYIYSDDGNIFIDKKVKKGYSGQTITAYDINMNEVDSFTFPSKTAYETLGGQDKDNFLITLPDENNEYYIYYIDKSKIGTFNGKAPELKKICKITWSKGNISDYIITE